jgi:protein arginine kinase activator
MDAMPLCTQCGFTWGEYRSRGLLGCPHCYAAFGEALQGDLLWIHRALAAPIGPADAAPDPDVPERMAQWKEQLADAVRKEDYAEAARLQALLRGKVGQEGLEGPDRDPHAALG